VGGGSSMMRAAPLPRCTVTGVVTVVNLPHVLGILAVKPVVRLWALGTRVKNPTPKSLVWDPTPRF